MALNVITYLDAADVTRNLAVDTITIGADTVDVPVSVMVIGVEDGPYTIVSKINPVPMGGNTAADGAGTEQRILTVGGRPQVDVISSASHAVTGTFWQAVQPVSASSLPLPTSAATSTLQTTGNTSLASIDSKITAVNTGATVVTSSALPAGAATDANLATIAGHVDGLEAATGTTADADSATTMIGRLKKLVALFAGGLPAALTGSGNLKVAVQEALPAGTNNIGDVDVLSTVAPTAATAALVNETATATSKQLLPSTGTRKGGSFFNDSTARLYLKHGTTASTTSFTVILEPGGYYELPAPIYTGRIDGIWSAANGAVRITEHS